MTPEDREERRKYWNDWYSKNKHAKSQACLGYTKRVSDRRKERYATDPNYKIKQRVHSDMWKITRGILKSGWLFKLLGCTLDEFSTHIEAQFEEGMTFDNLGEWEVDHIKALGVFDLTDPDQLATACHYTNTRPLWKKDNRKDRR